jgi:hypothetical protein
VADFRVPGYGFGVSYTSEAREALRRRLIEVARSDSRLSGGAITGSAALDAEDRWSDIDLAFGVRDASRIPEVLRDFSERMARDHGALHYLDVPSGAWIYRVFLLPSTLQVDLAFAPEAEFAARAPSFRLVFGNAVEKPLPPAAAPESLIGYAWLYALHARSSIARGRPWQAEYMISGMRDQVLALACVRHGLPSKEGRGIDRLPAEVTAPQEEGLVRSLETSELSRAFRAVSTALIEEVRRADPALAGNLEPVLRELAGIQDA